MSSAEKVLEDCVDDGIVDDGSGFYVGDVRCEFGDDLFQKTMAASIAASHKAIADRQKLPVAARRNDYSITVQQFHQWYTGPMVNGPMVVRREFAEKK